MLLMAFLVLCTSHTAAAAEKIPVILDTDVGDDRGITKIDAAGTKLDVATEWKDMAAYCTYLVEILTGRKQ